MASTVSVPVEDLRGAGLDPAFEKLDTAIANHHAGNSTNIAVVADPFAGREVLLDYAQQRLETDAARIRLSSVVADGSPVDLPESDVVIVDNCQYLFRREIGGYDVLEQFLEEIAMSDTLYITGWNRYAWDYLAAVRDVDRSFPVQVRIPVLDAGEVEQLIHTHHKGRLPTFKLTSKDGRIKTVNLVRHPIRLWGARSVEVPIPRPNPEWISSWPVLGDNKSIEAVVFEKIRRVAHGNPGVATTVWDDSVTSDEIAPAYVRDPVEEITVDDDQAFMLSVVVSMESIERDALAALVGSDTIEKKLHPLVEEGVVDVADGRVSITPMGLHQAVAELQRRRLLW